MNIIRFAKEDVMPLDTMENIVNGIRGLSLKELKTFCDYHNIYYHSPITKKSLRSNIVQWYKVNYSYVWE